MSTRFDTYEEAYNFASTRATKPAQRSNGKNGFNVDPKHYVVVARGADQGVFDSF